MHKLKKITLVAVCVTAIPFGHNALASSISEQMNAAMGTLSNVTSPAAYDSARRGVLSGGQAFIKMPTKRVNVLSATMPSVSAGCGGISIYGGSFSYLNADQFVQTFQAIGSNAIGYGVKLALSSACATCEQVMTSLEKTAQAINSMNIDSCKAAQGIVNATADFAQGQQSDALAKTGNVLSGIASDFSEAWDWSNEESTSMTKELQMNDPDTFKEEFSGNIAWKTFKALDLSTAFGATDENEFYQMLMSITGTTIVSLNGDTSKEELTPKAISGNIIKLKDLINGGENGKIKIYKCADGTGKDECLDVPAAPTLELSEDGLIARIRNAYTADDGFIAALKSNAEWSNTAKEVIEFPTITSVLCNKTIRRGVLENANDVLLYDIVETCATKMAIDLAYSKVSQYFDTAITAIESMEFPQSLTTSRNETIQMFKDNRSQYYQEYRELSVENSYEAISVKLNDIDFSDGHIKEITGE